MVAVATIHVDDIVVAASKEWLNWCYKCFVAKFGKLKRQELPFTNVGMEYSRTVEGGIALRQINYAEALKPLATTGVDMGKPLNPAGVTSLRGGIGAVLFLGLARWGLLFDLVLLQGDVFFAEVPGVCRLDIFRS